MPFRSCALGAALVGLLWWSGNVIAGGVLILVPGGQIDRAMPADLPLPDGTSVRRDAVVAACGLGGSLLPEAGQPAVYDPASGACARAVTATPDQLPDVQAGVDGFDGVVQDALAARHWVVFDTRIRRACLVGHCAVLGAPTGGLLTINPSPPPPPPPPVVINSFNASASVITEGDSVTLSWTTSNAALCSLTDDPGGSVSVATNSSAARSPSVSTVFTLTCSGGGVTTYEQVTVTVNPAPASVVLNYFIVTPSSINVGQYVYIYWSASNADSCELRDLFTGTTETFGRSGFLKRFPDSTKYYRLLCSNATSNAYAYRYLRVTQVTTPPSIDRFSASPTTIETGSVSYLSWSVAGAVECTIRNNLDRAVITARLPSSSIKLAPSNTTTYTMYCSNANGSDSAAATITVQTTLARANMVSFEVSPERLVSRGVTTLTWNSQETEGCRVSAGEGEISVPPSGVFSLEVDETTTIEAVCTGEGQTQGVTTIEVVSEDIAVHGFEGEE